MQVGSTVCSFFKKLYEIQKVSLSLRPGIPPIPWPPISSYSRHLNCPCDPMAHTPHTPYTLPHHISPHNYFPILLSLSHSRSFSPHLLSHTSPSSSSSSHLRLCFVLVQEYDYHQEATASPSSCRDAAFPAEASAPTEVAPRVRVVRRRARRGDAARGRPTPRRAAPRRLGR